MDNAADASDLSGSALFYNRPELLSSARHANLGLHSSAKPFGFAAQATALPLTVMEFVPAASTFPIIFTPDERRLPLAVTGLTDDQNLFVEPDGSYLPGAYMPAYLRRYPFITAEDSAGERLVVCIERDTPLVSETGDVRLFQNGEATDYTKNCIQFCQNFEQDRQRTAAFIDYLKRYDLFGEREITQPVVNAAGERVNLPLSTVTVVSEEKFNALPSEVFLEMRGNGALPHIYAHFQSQGNWERLLALRSAREIAGREPGALQ